MAFGAAAGLATGLTVSGLSSGIMAPVKGVMIAPWERYWHYAGNKIHPIVFPEPGQLLDAYTRHFLSQQAYEEAIAVHGIDSKGIRNDVCHKLWRVIEDAVVTRPQLGLAFELHRAGLASEKEMIEWIYHEGYESWATARRIAQLVDAPYDTTTTFALNRRGLISADQAVANFRRLGYVEPGRAERVLSLSTEYPGPSDLVRFMVRDVADPGVVNRFMLDAEFSDKFQGELARWTKYAGVPQDVMQAYWRAHWDVPSPTQLYEMLRRLRPGQVDPEVETTVNDVYTALSQNDVLPFWRSRLVAISYHVPGLRMVQDMFNAGVTDESKVYQQWQDQGYSPADSVLFTNLSKHRKRVKTAGDTGQLTPKQVLTLYKSYNINKDDAKARLIAWGYTDNDATLGLFDIEQLRKVKIRDKCRTALERRYQLGELDYASAVNILMQQGNEQVDAQEIAAGWQCELEAKGKAISASELCGWVERGLVTVEEFALRLLRMGYTAVDAQRIVAMCNLTLLEKKAKALEAQARKEQAVKDKYRRLQDNAIKDLQKKEEKLRKQTEKHEQDLRRAIDNERKRQNNIRKSDIKGLQALLKQFDKDQAVLLKEIDRLVAQGVEPPSELSEAVRQLQADINEASDRLHDLYETNGAASSVS